MKETEQLKITHEKNEQANEELAKLRAEVQEKSKSLENLNEQQAEMERILYEEKTNAEQHNIVLAKKDNDYHELKVLLEEKLTQIEVQQNQNIDLGSKFKLVKEKRENGLKEIAKLKKQLEESEPKNNTNSPKINNEEAQNAAKQNDYNSKIEQRVEKFNMMVGFGGNSLESQTYNMGQRPSFINNKQDTSVSSIQPVEFDFEEFLQKMMGDQQKSYKKVVMLIPQDDVSANKTIIDVERRLNDLINQVCDHMA